MRERENIPDREAKMSRSMVWTGQVSEQFEAHVQDMFNPCLNQFCNIPVMFVWQGSKARKKHVALAQSHQTANIF